MPSNDLSNVALEEMRNKQMKFNKEVLETLQLMRQEIKDNQEKMKEELKKSEKSVMHRLQLMRTEQETKQNKMMREVEAIWNDVTKSTETKTIRQLYLKFQVLIYNTDVKITVEMLPTDTILDLKKEIEKERNVPVLRQSVFFNQKITKTNRPLANAVSRTAQL
uniref:Ubiquitin-like domain-containing protein n=1 Tax=Caenorhabditis tropicalis TaxID=1561998 RepID=A0A1I7U5A1_9PELO